MFAAGAFHGAVVLQTLQMPNNKTVYLIGEMHNLNGSCGSKASTHVIDTIMTYANDHPAEKIAIAFEAANFELTVGKQPYLPPTGVSKRADECQPCSTKH